MPGTLVIVPTHRESGTIGALIEGVRRALPDATILVVDDASDDGTRDIVRSHAASLGGIHMLERPTKNGLGNAYRTGFEWGLERGHDVLVEIDADLSHDPAVLPELESAARLGADLVIGSRYVPGGRILGWPRKRLLLSRWGNRYVALMLGLAVNDATAGYRAFRAEALRACDVLSTTSDGYAFQIETTYRFVRSNRRIVEIPIVFREREIGSSKMSGAIVREALLLVTRWGIADIVLRRRRPDRA